MSIPVVCASCSAKLNAPDSAAGKRVKCPKCQTAMVVPAAQLAAPAFEVVEDEPAKKPTLKPAKPQVKTDVVVEEDEPKPQKKRVQAAVEDDDNEDDRPRKKKKQPAAGNSAMTRNIIGGVVLLVLLGVAGWVFYDKFGKKDGDTAGNGNGGNPPTPPPERPVEPGNPGNPGQWKAPPTANPRIKSLQTAIGDLNRVIDETTSTLDAISNNETALAAVGPVEAAAAKLKKLNEQLKGFGKLYAADAVWVPAPSGKGVAALRAAVTKVTGLIDRKEVSGKAADSLADALLALNEAMAEVTKTVVEMWPDRP